MTVRVYDFAVDHPRLQLDTDIGAAERSQALNEGLRRDHTRHSRDLVQNCCTVRASFETPGSPSSGQGCVRGLDKS